MLEQIFSVKNEGKHKVVKMLGISCKFRRNQSEEMLKKNKSILEKSKSMLEKNKKILEELLFYAKRENPHKDMDVQPAQNLKLTMAKIAAEDSARFIMKNCITAPAFESRHALLTYALSQVEVKGMYMEFGVYNGNSINHIAKQKPDETIYGFDSFEGLPEDWQSYYQKGHFKLDNLPKVESNVKLIKGWFDESLPKFIEENGDFKVAFINNDFTDISIIDDSKLEKYYGRKVVQCWNIRFNEGQSFNHMGLPKWYAKYVLDTSYLYYKNPNKKDLKVIKESPLIKHYRDVQFYYPNGISKRLMIIGDSFGLNLLDFIPYNFKDTLYIYNNPRNFYFEKYKQDIEKYKPDALVLLFYTPNIPKFLNLYPNSYRNVEVSK